MSVLAEPPLQLGYGWPPHLCQCFTMASVESTKVPSMSKSKPATQSTSADADEFSRLVILVQLS